MGVSRSNALPSSNAIIPRASNFPVVQNCGYPTVINNNPWMSSNKDLIVGNNPLLIRGGNKTGVGVTGEGIPLEEVKPDVLEQIYPDDTGAYGYLSKEGTRYAKYDFTDVEMAQKNRLIREEYLEQSQKIQNEYDKMVQEGASKEEIADCVVNMRNQDKVAARAKMTTEEVGELEAGNMKIYDNPVGPDAKWLFNKTKKDLLRKGVSATDDEIWKLVIEGSMRKDDVINTLLGLKH